MARKPRYLLEPGWVIAPTACHGPSIEPGRPARHAMVHVHGWISGTYQADGRPSAQGDRTFVLELPGMGRSIRPEPGLKLPGLAKGR